jgi:hypothetical protein
LGPHDDVELYLVKRAVALSWELDRADRAPRPRPRRGSPGDSDDGPVDTMATVHRPSLDAGASAGWLQPQRLAWTQALLGTLDLFVRLRQVGGSAASGLTAQAVQREAPPVPAQAVAGCSPPAAEPAGGAREAALESASSCEPGVAPEEVSDRQDASRPGSATIRHRIARRRRLDASVPISRADRVPIRLRRKESGVAFARAAASPPSGFPPEDEADGRARSRRRVAQ